MRRAFVLVVGLVLACGAKKQVVEEPEMQVNSCESAIASVQKAPRKSDATCMRVLKIARQPPAADSRVLVLARLAPGPTLEDPAGGKEAKAIKVRRDGAFHDDCPAAGAFVEVEGKLSADSGLVEARIVRVLDDWKSSSCAADEGPPPPPRAAPPPPFDKAAAGTAVVAADADMKKKCATPGVPASKGHVKITFMADGSVGAVDVDTPPFAGTKTAKCIEEVLKATIKVPPFTGEAVTVSRDFTL